MHSSVLGVALVSVAVELIAHDHAPVSLVTVRFGLQEALPLEKGILLLPLCHTEILNYFLFIRCVVV